MKRRRFVSVSITLITLSSIVIGGVVCDEGSNGDGQSVESLAERMYQTAMKMINETKSGPLKGAYFLLSKSSELNHSQSQELVAKAHLFGDHLPLNLTEASRLFKKLASEGSPTAQLVSCAFDRLFPTIN